MAPVRKKKDRLSDVVPGTERDPVLSIQDALYTHTNRLRKKYPSEEVDEIKQAVLKDISKVHYKEMDKLRARLFKEYCLDNTPGPETPFSMVHPDGCRGPDYQEFVRQEGIGLRMPYYLFDYLNDVADFNNMSVRQVLVCIIYKMFANDRLSGIPTDFGAMFAGENDVSLMLPGMGYIDGVVEAHIARRNAKNAQERKGNNHA